jgi:hypothetical protein
VLSAKGLSASPVTTAAIGTAASGAGAYVLLLQMASPTGTGTYTAVSCTDSAGNSYTVAAGTLAGPSNSAGQAGAILVSGSNPNALLTTSTFTVTATGTTIGKYVLHVLKIDVPPTVVAGTGAAGTLTGGSTIAVTSGTPAASGDYLWLGTMGWGSSGQTATISSTGYTLIPTGTAVEGTTGGSATTNISAKEGYQQVLASASPQTFNGTLSGNASCPGASIVALSVVAAAPAKVGTPIVVSQAVSRAATR